MNDSDQARAELAERLKYATINAPPRDALEALLADSALVLRALGMERAKWGENEMSGVWVEPPTDHDVWSVGVIEGPSSDWRRAIGAVPRDEDGPRAEAVIRKIRDAQ